MLPSIWERGGLDKPGSGNDTQKSMKISLEKQTGIGTYAFRYAIGFGGFASPVPMDAYRLLDEVNALGLRRCLVCENLPFMHNSDGEFRRIKKYADERKITVEIGFRNLTDDNLARHLAAVDIFESPFLRVVLNENGSPRNVAENEKVLADAEALIRKRLPDLRRRNVTLLVENYFDHDNSHLVRLVRNVGSSEVRIVFDTNNCFGFLKTPEEAFGEVAAHTSMIHLKDYEIRKVEAGYFITGTVLGEGWLDASGFVRHALDANPDMVFLIEMAVRRKDGASPGETVAAERDQIARSVRKLKEILRAADSGSG